MRTLGLIGGTTWLSTVEYYRIINQEVNRRLGKANTARILLYSVNHEEFLPPSDEEGWISVRERLIEIAGKLEAAGAESLLLCANTMHKVAGEVSANIGIPLIHIAEVSAAAIRKAGVKKVGLLGTKVTMEGDFFKQELLKQSIETVIPGDRDREFINNSIFKEFGKGIFSQETKQGYLEIIDRLVAAGAEGIILGCTEIPLLIKPGDFTAPTFDTTLLHATAAVDFALEGS